MTTHAKTVEQHVRGRSHCGDTGYGHAHVHGHSAGDTVRQIDWSVRGPQLVTAGEVSAPMVDQALVWLAERVPDARTVLDIGSGPGVAACRFAEVLPLAQVMAVDGAPELLAMARDRAAALGVDLVTRAIALP